MDLNQQAKTKSPLPPAQLPGGADRELIWSNPLFARWYSAREANMCPTGSTLKTNQTIAYDKRLFGSQDV